VVVREEALPALKSISNFRGGPQNNFVNRIVTFDTADLRIGSFAGRKKKVRPARHRGEPPAGRTFVPFRAELQQIGHAHSSSRP